MQFYKKGYLYIIWLHDLAWYRITYVKIGKWIQGNIRLNRCYKTSDKDTIVSFAQDIYYRPIDLYLFVIGIKYKYIGYVRISKQNTQLRRTLDLCLS